MPETPPTSVLILAASVASASVALWAVLLIRWRNGIPPIWPRARREVPWNGLLVLAIALVSLLLPALVATLMSAQGLGEAHDLSPHETANVMFAFSVTGLAVCGAGIGLLVLISGASRDDLGLPGSPNSAASDLLLGGAGFLVVALPIYGLQAILTQWQEYSHPIMEMLTEGKEVRLWAAACFSAVVVAPLTEEFVFRLLLQGWLHKLVAAISHSKSAANVDPPVEQELQTGSDTQGTLLQFEESPADDNTYRAPNVITQTDHVLEEVESPASTSNGRIHDPRAMIVPILISSALFAVMHLGQGPAPIPLFFLGIALGYIYHQTGRLLPCVALHVLFNGFSLLVFWLSQAVPGG